MNYLISRKNRKNNFHRKKFVKSTFYQLLNVAFTKFVIYSPGEINSAKVSEFCQTGTINLSKPKAKVVLKVEHFSDSSLGMILGKICLNQKFSRICWDFDKAVTNPLNTGPCPTIFIFIEPLWKETKKWDFWIHSVEIREHFVTWILREIDIWKSTQSVEISGSFRRSFFRTLHFEKTEIYQKSKYKASKCLKMADFALLEYPKSISRKI